MTNEINENKSSQIEQLCRERHSRSLDYAINQIVNWNASACIEAIYLYGSYARGKYGYDSDVDIYIELHKEPDRKALRKLKCDILPNDSSLPDVDLHFGFAPLETYSDLFHQNIKEDGILLWKKK